MSNDTESGHVEGRASRPNVMQWATIVAKAADLGGRDDGRAIVLPNQAAHDAFAQWYADNSPRGVTVLTKIAPAPSQSAPLDDATRVLIEEAASVFESAAKHNKEQGRTIFAHAQQDRADRLRAALARAPSRDDDVALELARRWKDRAEKAEAALAHDGQEPLTVDDYQAKLLSVFVASFRAGPEGGKLVPSEEMASFYFKHVVQPAEADDVRDAARYRWLRESAYIELRCDSPRADGWDASSLDKAIDAAIAASLAGKDKQNG